MTHEDIEWVRKLRNHERLWFLDERYISCEDQHRWWDNTDRQSWYVVKTDTHEPVGLFFFRESYVDGIYEFGSIIIDTKYRGTGVLRLMVDHCFQREGIKLVYVLVKNKNIRMLKAIKKCDFKVIGNISSDLILLEYGI
jgi:RimJ/RimL family protein N-acetyltransferase